jgi:hypothetical protein
VGRPDDGEREGERERRQAAGRRTSEALRESV